MRAHADVAGAQLPLTSNPPQRSQTLRVQASRTLGNPLTWYRSVPSRYRGTYPHGGTRMSACAWMQRHRPRTVQVCSRLRGSNYQVRPTPPLSSRPLAHSLARLPQPCPGRCMLHGAHCALHGAPCTLRRARHRFNLRACLSMGSPCTPATLPTNTHKHGLTLVIQT